MRIEYIMSSRIGWDSVLKLAAVAALLMVFLSVIFYILFQNVGYDSFWLSITNIAAILVLGLIVVLWRILKKI